MFIEDGRKVGFWYRFMSFRVREEPLICSDLSNTCSKIKSPVKSVAKEGEDDKGFLKRP